MEAGKLAAQWLISTSWILALLWWFKALQVLRGMPRLTDLTRLDKESLPTLPTSDAPDLTVIVPGCNEEDSIEATLRSLLASTGLRLEIIAVDDRSTDRTGERMDAMAAEAAKSGPHTLMVIHNASLPEGWLGKTHALKLGADRATAPWLLMTDADVTFAPDALERALRAALWKGADHMAMVPSLTRTGFAEAAMEGTMSSLAAGPCAFGRSRTRRRGTSSAWVPSRWCEGMCWRRRAGWNGCAWKLWRMWGRDGW